MNMNIYSQLSMDELRLLGTKNLRELAEEIIRIFNIMDQCYDEDFADDLNELDELYTRVDYILSE